jgi:hypothetical protein
LLRSVFRLPRPFGSFLLVAAATTFSPIRLDAQSSSTNDIAPQPSSNQSTVVRNFFHPQTSFSLGTFGQVTPTRIDSRTVPGVIPTYGVEQTYFLTSGASPTAGVLGTFRQQFRPWLGYSVNMGYTRLTERFTQYSNISNPYSEDSYDVKVNTDMYELSLSYTASKQLTPRMSGFAEAGAGALAFLPVVPHSAVSAPNNSFQNQFYFANVAFAPETVGGLGVHWHLANSFGLRAEYRGLIYTNTVFQHTVHKAMTLSSEPTVSLTYSFGHK